MARIRTIKPEFFRHERLFEAECETGLPLRIAFAGLWTAADREGRFKWAPKQLKLDCLPFDNVDFSDVMSALEASGFIIKYDVQGTVYGFIPSWKDHQVINQREAQSKLPHPDHATHVHARACTCDAIHIPNGANIPTPLRETVYARDGRKCLRCGSSDDLTIDHIFPQSMGGSHAVTNLRTLCRSCNSRRPVAGQSLIDDLKIDGLTFDDMQRTCMHVHARGEGKGKEGKEIDRERGAREPLISPEAFDLSNSIIKALGEDREAPDWNGFPYMVQNWLTEKIPKDFALSVCANLRGKHRNYLDKAVQNSWRDKQNEPARKTTHGPSTGNIMPAIESLIERVSNLDRPSKICSTASNAPVRMLPEGGRERSRDLHSGGDRDPGRLPRGRDSARH